jgi:hypothetical protein
MTMQDTQLPELVEAPVREWVAPQIECYETRPEVTAYAGDGSPWQNH